MQYGGWREGGGRMEDAIWRMEGGRREEGGCYMEDGGWRRQYGGWWMEKDESLKVEKISGEEKGRGKRGKRGKGERERGKEGENKFCWF